MVTVWRIVIEKCVTIVWTKLFNFGHCVAYVIEKCVTLVWTKQFSFGHCVACCYWKVRNISLNKTVQLWSLCGVLLLKRVYCSIFNAVSDILVDLADYVFVGKDHAKLHGCDTKHKAVDIFVKKIKKG